MSEFLIIFAARYLYLAIVAIAAVAFILAEKTKKIDILRLTALSFPLAYIIAKTSGYFIYNPRPFVVENIKPLIEHAADNGFPSDHTLISMAIASVFFVFNRKLGIFLAILALIVGAGRVLAGVHHPVDILGSVIISAASVYFSLLALRKIK